MLQNILSQINSCNRKKPYIFISYSSQDNRLVFEDVLQFQKNGYNIWLDEKNLDKTQESWKNDALRAIEDIDCYLFIFYMSQSSLCSESCYQELKQTIAPLTQAYHHGPLKFIVVEAEPIHNLNEFTDTIYEKIRTSNESKETRHHQALALAKIIGEFFDNNNERVRIHYRHEENRMKDYYEEIQSFFPKETYITNTIKNNLQFDKQKNITSKEAYNITFYKNIDTELTQKFEQQFVPSSVPFRHSPIQQKIIKSKQAHFLTSFIDATQQAAETLSSTKGLFSSLIPLKYGDRNHIEKHFTITDLPGYKSIIFEIQEKIDYKTLTKYSICEPLSVYHHEAMENIPAKTSYYVNISQEKDIAIIILYFDITTHSAFVNMGLITTNTVKISKKPIFIDFSSIKIPSTLDKILHLSTSTYNINSIIDIELNKIEYENNIYNNERWYEANTNASIIIVDPETALPIKRELYYDEVNCKWKAKINLKSYYSYFAFEIRTLDKNGNQLPNHIPLSNIEIANYYKDGLYGFPKNSSEAASYFEKDGSKYSIYQIATLFRDDETIYDESTYLDYLHQSIEKGCTEASIELAITLLISGSESNKTEGRALLEKIQTNNPMKNFIIGFFIEKKILPGDLKSAFNHYYISAKSDFAPACARFEYKETILSKDALYKNFIEHQSNNDLIADYCIGCALFFGIGISSYKTLGLQILKNAAYHGSHCCIEALYTIFDLDSEYMDKKEALEWLKLLQKFKPSVSCKLANRLLDGIGCKICDTNDKLAFELLQTASNDGNKIAQNNLGWMYKNGRGCHTDYSQAIHLFENTNIASSQFNLGDMYEHGLGVQKDINVAIQYYQKAAEKNYQKAIDRLTELKIREN